MNYDTALLLDKIRELERELGLRGENTQPVLYYRALYRQAKKELEDSKRDSTLSKNDLDKLKLKIEENNLLIKKQESTLKNLEKRIKESHSRLDKYLLDIEKKKTKLLSLEKAIDEEVTAYLNLVYPKPVYQEIKETWELVPNPTETKG